MNKKELMNLAKRANARLRNLEKKGATKTSNAYRHIEALADRRKDIFSTTVHGEIKFRTDYTGIEKDNALEDYEKTLNKFIDAKTSTSSGISEKYDKAYQSFVSNPNNPNISKEAYVDMFNRSQTSAWYEALDSKSKMILAEMLENGQITQDTLDKLDAKYMTLEKDEILRNRFITDIIMRLRDYKTLDDLVIEKTRARNKKYGKYKSEKGMSKKRRLREKKKSKLKSRKKKRK